MSSIYSDSIYSDDELVDNRRHIQAPSARRPQHPPPPHYVRTAARGNSYVQPRDTVIPTRSRTRERQPNNISPTSVIIHYEDGGSDDDDRLGLDKPLKTAYSLTSRSQFHTERSSGKRRAHKRNHAEVVSSCDAELRALAYADGMARQRELYRPLILDLNRRAAEAHALAAHQRATPPLPAYYEPYPLFPPPTLHRSRGWDAFSEYSEEESEEIEKPQRVYGLNAERLWRERDRDARAYIERGRAMSQGEVRRRAESDGEGFQAASRRQRLHDLETELEQLRREERSQWREG